jgi:peptidoglycan/LPS O-acetylase OafA/YrhL
MRHEHLRPLTSLRFFAAAAIVAFHIGGAFGLFRLGVLANGVSFFFVLSGFILTYTYRDLSGRTDIYFVSRIARLLPVHLFTLAIAAVFVTGFAGPLVTLSNVFLVHSWIPLRDFVFSYNAVSWSISDEMFFYLMFPLILATNRIGLWVLVTAVATISAAFCLSVVALPEWLDVRNVVLQHPTMRLAEFVFGIFTARMFLRRGPAWSARTGTIAEIAVLVFMLCYFVARTFVITRPADSGYLALSVWLSQCSSYVVFGLVIYVFATGSGAVSAILSNRWLVLLGEISFATYMWHQLVISLVVQHRMVPLIGVEMTVVVVLAATYVGSYLIWRYLELPSRKAIVAAYRDRFRRADAAESTANP